MIRRPPSSNRTDPLFPCPTRFRSGEPGPQLGGTGLDAGVRGAHALVLHGGGGLAALAGLLVGGRDIGFGFVVATCGAEQRCAGDAGPQLHVTAVPPVSSAEGRWGGAWEASAIGRE